MLKSCRWDGVPFDSKHPNEQYCSDYCKEQGRLDKKRKWQNEYDKKAENKRKKKTQKKGTFDLPSFKPTTTIPSYLGVPLPFWEWYKEYKVIQTLKKQHKNSRPYSKEKEWYNTTHQYVTTEDYHTFNVSYTMRAYTKCLNPECPTNTITGATSPILLTRDLKHCETVCQTCGTVLNHPGMRDNGKGGRMAVTNVDIFNSGIERQSIQSIARNRYWEHTSELLERCNK